MRSGLSLDKVSDATAAMLEELNAE